MIGILIKTQSNLGFFIGLITNYLHRDKEKSISVGVTWNDCDNTTETFSEYDDNYDTTEYFFYDKGRWWLVDENYYRFKRLLEG